MKILLLFLKVVHLADMLIMLPRNSGVVVIVIN